MKRLFEAVAHWLSAGLLVRSRNTPSVAVVTGNAMFGVWTWLLCLQTLKRWQRLEGDVSPQNHHGNCGNC